MPDRDDLLAGAVRRALALLPEVDPYEMRIEAIRGIVHLDGVTRSLAAKAAAERAALAVPGVRGLHSRIAVEAPHPPTDREQQAALAQALADDPLTRSRDVGARAAGGTAILVGHVPHAAMAERAADVIARVPGVADILPAERVGGVPSAGEGPRDAGDLAGWVIDALDGEPDLEPHAVQVIADESGGVRLVGHVASEERKARAGAVAAAVPGVHRVVNDLVIAGCGVAAAEAPPTPRTDARHQPPAGSPPEVGTPEWLAPHPRRARRQGRRGALLPGRPGEPPHPKGRRHGRTGHAV